jgi:hypothetical protein
MCSYRHIIGTSESMLVPDRLTGRFISLIAIVALPGPFPAGGQIVRLFGDGRPLESIFFRCGSSNAWSLHGVVEQRPGSSPLGFSAYQ